MKKLFALFLISIMLLSSCKGPIVSKNPEHSTDHSVEKNEMLSFPLFILTDKYPIKTEEYLTQTPPTSFDNVFYVSSGMEILTENTLSQELTVPCTITEINPYTKEEELYAFESKKAGIIDNKDALVECFEKGKDVKYSDHFSDDFFEKNIILFVRIDESYASPFWSVEYEFNTANKKLTVTFSEIEHEGWLRNTTEIEGPYNYFIVIAKSDLTIDGNLVPYDELNIEVTGKLTVQ